MLESLLGLFTPCARQNEGRFVNVCPAGVTSVPDVTTVAAVMPVFPSKVSDVRPEQETRLPSSRPRACAAALPISTAAGQATRAKAKIPGRPMTVVPMSDPLPALARSGNGRRPVGGRYLGEQVAPRRGARTTTGT